MADIELVIKISEENYEWIKEHKGVMDFQTSEMLYNRVRKGTPLSEVLEDIKEEIADIYCGAYCDNPYTAGEVREQALDIIDKHISGKEQ